MYAGILPWFPLSGTEAGQGGEREGKLEGNLAGSHWRAKDIPRPGAEGFLAQNFQDLQSQEVSMIFFFFPRG